MWRWRERNRKHYEERADDGVRNHSPTRAAEPRAIESQSAAHGGIVDSTSVTSAAARRPWIARRSRHDAEIWRLALPAFGALAAEPLYLLVDTAIIGHLGTDPLAGLAIAGIVLTSAYGICNFLAYSTKAAVARRIGAKQWKAAAEQGIDGLWLATAIGVALAIIGVALAPLIVDAMGASSAVRPYALTYLRISLIGAPAMLVTLAGNGYLRGVQPRPTAFGVT
jgi:Na+-driven multidrug efflux pump